MDFQGTDDTVVQMLEGGWKWSFEINGRVRSGVVFGTRQVAMRRAEYEIDKALAPKKMKLVKPGEPV
jgi:hypothetical protein